MRYIRVVFGILLLAGLIASSAMADPIDPRVTLNGGGGSPTTTAGATDINPFIVYDGSGVTDFLYEGPATNMFYVEVLPSLNPDDAALFPGEQWFCDPGIAATCATAPTTQSPAVEFVFNGPVGGTFITPGMDLSVSVPEPGVLVLLFVGLACAIAFGWPKRNAARA